MQIVTGERIGPRILVAEDEPLAALVIEDALTESGYQVELAGDGEAALALSERGGFDVVVTDLAMPRMTGWELIAALRARQPDLPIVVMTGYLPPGGRDALFADGCTPAALLLKPFGISDLLAALRQVSRGAERAGAPQMAST